MITYYVIDNGGRPFKVDIDDKNVTIYKEKIQNKYYKKPLMIFENVEKIFIGKSPLNAMTKKCNTYSKKFDGNSILLNIKDNIYVFIGWDIYQFKSLSKINTFVSPVGPSAVPYPYAIDNKKRYYLMLDDIIINNKPKNKDIYDYYYDNENKKYKKFKNKKILVKRFY